MSRDSHFSLEDLSRIDLRRLPADGGPDFNRLVFEKSPYLLQHATNPVDWFPWGDEALALARTKDMPIFLSVGYSTCHWCHVMAGESFADPGVAAVLNRHYVPIKVDREERPDIDATYMQACQAMTGSGGWPLNVLLTPDLLPFFAATYVPKDDRHGMSGLITLLERIADLWRTEKVRIEDSGAGIRALLQKSEELAPGTVIPARSTLEAAVDQFRRQFDPLYGGFGQAPKFPAPHNLSLLLRLGRRLDDPAATSMALDTLRAIRLGGIYDQLGGGIHRYSVDERWLVPHFEKMLYDQALLILAGVDAWQASGDGFYRDLAADTALYVTRDLAAPAGGFHCGEDADAEGREGTTYLWDKDEIVRTIGPERSADVVRMFGLTDGGNFEGRNILHLPEGLDEELLTTARKILLPVRRTRIQPHLDDKIITAWNGLTIAALARLGALTSDDSLIDSAGCAADFIRGNLTDRSGRLLRRWRQGEASIPAFLEDYAFMIWGLIELCQARFLARDLEWAISLAEGMLDLFGDGRGGLYDTGHDSETILVRGRNLQDGAIPSGNGAAALALLRLGQMTGREPLCEAGERLLERNAGLIGRYPTAFAVSLQAAEYLAGPAATLIVAGESLPPELADVIFSRMRPGLELLLKREAGPDIAELAPVASGKTPIDGKTAAWLCRDRSCREPVTDPGRLEEILDGL